MTPGSFPVQAVGPWKKVICNPVVLVIAAVAMSENPAAFVKNPNVPGAVMEVNKAPNLDFYEFVVSLSRGKGVWPKLCL